MKLGILSLGIFCLEASARATASKVGLTLFSEPEFKGSRCEIQDVDLKTEACCKHSPGSFYLGIC